MNDRQGRWRTSRDADVGGDAFRDPGSRRKTRAEDAAGKGAGPNGQDPLGGGHGFIGLFQGETKMIGDRPGD